MVTSRRQLMAMAEERATQQPPAIDTQLAMALVRVASRLRLAQPDKLLMGNCPIMARNTPKTEEKWVLTLTVLSRDFGDQHVPYSRPQDECCRLLQAGP